MKKIFLILKKLHLNKIMYLVLSICIIIFDIICFKRIFNKYNEIHIVCINNKKYCVSSWYFNAKKIRGLIKINNNSYYFGDDFAMVEDETVEINGKTYVFGHDGKLIKNY